MIIRNIHYNDFDKNLIQLYNQLSYCSIIDKNIFKFFLEKLNDEHNIFVVEYNNKIIAAITYFIETKIIRDMGKVLHIEDLVVDKEYRNKHLGKKLIEKTIEIGKKNNCYKIILNCSKDYINYYEKFGFKLKNNQMAIYF